MSLTSNQPDTPLFFNYLNTTFDYISSSAGAQLIWDYCNKFGNNGQQIGQILSLCIASHHSGLIDCLEPSGKNGFKKRIEKDDKQTHKNECLNNSLVHYKKNLDKLLSAELLKSVALEINNLSSLSGAEGNPTIREFYRGLWTRMLFSCLIDADRINSADFEYPENTQYRSRVVDWSIPVDRFESAIKDFKSGKDIDVLRRNISDTCKSKAEDQQGIYTLTVPTGGGKTYSSLRYALHHAHHHKLERIIYIIPFTSIIEQNAKAIREVIESSEDEYPWVLEQHSNLEPEQQTWHSKLVSENWDAPIIMTTMVQFLEVLFSGGTRGVRKMHQLAKSLLIFDEIQTLPIKCTHLFCNALNFLAEYCNTTVLLCTATQPLLDQLRSPEKGQLHIGPENELVKDVPKLFQDLRRVKVVSGYKPGGWAKEEIADLVLTEFKSKGNCLVIVNTKSWAHQLYECLHEEIKADAIFHLSTNLCPAHRKNILDLIRKRLDDKLPVLCISTQLIEAGVDIDFASVIRFFAGLDSIAQAAGRCNRNGEGDTATVHVINPDNESIDYLVDIKIGRDKALRVIDEGFDDLLAPKAIEQYFKYYFYERDNEMDYPIKDRKSGIKDKLLNLLSDNRMNVGSNNNTHLLQQSFKTAGKYFKAIDSPTQAVIVHYTSEGARLIAELCGVAKNFDVKRYRALLKKSQQYSVNVFPNVWKRLIAKGAVHEIQQGEGIYYLKEEYYSKKYGLSETPVSLMSTNIA